MGRNNTSKQLPLVTLKKKITETDLSPKIKIILKRKTSFQVYSVSKQKKVIVPNLPKALQVLKPGAKIFLRSSAPRKKHGSLYVVIQLSERSTAKRYDIKKSCLT